MYGFEIRKNTNNEGILMPEVVSVLAAHGTQSVRAAVINRINSSHKQEPFQNFGRAPYCFFLTSRREEPQVLLTVHEVN